MIALASQKQALPCPAFGMDTDASKIAITLPELAASIGANPRSVRNTFYLHPDQFPPAIYLPGCRGPRFLVSDVRAWLEARKTQPAPPPVTPKAQGRPRKASPSQIARARQERRQEEVA
jgi:predicted DNA-binding transcriptional regulator AlpA